MGCVLSINESTMVSLVQIYDFPFIVTFELPVGFNTSMDEERVSVLFKSMGEESVLSEDL